MGSSLLWLSGPPVKTVGGTRSGPLRGAQFRRRVEEDEDSAAGREPSLDDAARTPRLAVKEANADREDLVEAPISQVEVLKGHDEELGFAGFYVSCVSPRGGLDHLRRAVYRGEMAFFEALANERRRDPVPTPDLEHPLIWPNVHLVDDRSQPLAQNAASCPARPTLIVVASYPPPGRPRVSVRASPSWTRGPAWLGVERLLVPKIVLNRPARHS